jgi:hypothetical protein
MTEVKQGNKPHKCPVCDGAGLVSRPPWIAGDVPGWSSSDCAPHPCKPCFGTGIVWELTTPTTESQ